MTNSDFSKPVLSYLSLSRSDAGMFLTKTLDVLRKQVLYLGGGERSYSIEGIVLMDALHRDWLSMIADNRSMYWMP